MSIDCEHEVIEFEGLVLSRSKNVPYSYLVDHEFNRDITMPDSLVLAAKSAWNKIQEINNIDSVVRMDLESVIKPVVSSAFHQVYKDYFDFAEDVLGVFITCLLDDCEPEFKDSDSIYVWSVEYKNPINGVVSKSQFGYESVEKAMAHFLSSEARREGFDIFLFSKAAKIIDYMMRG